MNNAILQNCQGNIVLSKMFLIQLIGYFISNQQLIYRKNEIKSRVIVRAKIGMNYCLLHVILFYFILFGKSVNKVT